MRRAVPGLLPAEDRRRSFAAAFQCRHLRRSHAFRVSEPHDGLKSSRPSKVVPALGKYPFLAVTPLPTAGSGQLVELAAPSVSSSPPSLLPNPFRPSGAAPKKAPGSITIMPRVTCSIRPAMQGAPALPLDAQAGGDAFQGADQPRHVLLGMRGGAGDAEQVLRGGRPQHGVNVDALFQ